jgi:hypothetical protein
MEILAGGVALLLSNEGVQNLIRGAEGLKEFTFTGTLSPGFVSYICRCKYLALYRTDDMST